MRGIRRLRNTDLPEGAINARSTLAARRKAALRQILKSETK